MRVADGVLLVTRQGTSEKRQLQRGLEAIEQIEADRRSFELLFNTAHNDYYYHYKPAAAATAGKQPSEVRHFPNSPKYIAWLRPISLTGRICRQKLSGPPKIDHSQHSGIRTRRKYIDFAKLGS